MKRRAIILGAVAASLICHQSHGQTAEPTSGKKERVIKSQVPFEGIDQTWQNGSDRRDSSVLASKYVTWNIMVDANVNHSFNDPIDHTVVGSTAMARTDEMEVSVAAIGGDFSFGNARGRIMTQFGTRSTIVPRNDLSIYRGQYNLADVYRYISEAYAGYHFDVMHGINVDGGMFMSYLGLNSYYQVENWEYQASFTSDNTPWFFNGIRVQIFPSEHLKIEPWIINGWQSYGMFNKQPGIGGNITWCPNENVKMLTNDYYGADAAGMFNQMPGFGGNITWMPNSNMKLLTNDYYGTDAAGLSGRHRFHSDNSFLWRYYRRPKNAKGINQVALSLTSDVGMEKGDGVNGFTSDPVKGPAQYFASAMVYNRVWFGKSKWAWCVGGGWMKNPGRYLVLYPTGDASPLPNQYNPTSTAGTHPYSANIGDQFSGWDASTNISWMPNQSFEVRVEYVHREADNPYWAGPGGVTSPSGYTTTPVPAMGWAPDLVKTEDKVILAVLFRL